MKVIAPSEKRRQVASEVDVLEERRSFKRREWAMTVIAPSDKRRQVASGVDVLEERRGFKRREGTIIKIEVSFNHHH